MRLIMEAKNMKNIDIKNIIPKKIVNNTPTIVVHKINN